jgi:hypothetical protein
MGRHLLKRPGQVKSVAYSRLSWQLADRLLSNLESRDSRLATQWTALISSNLALAASERPARLSGATKFKLMAFRINFWNDVRAVIYSKGSKLSARNPGRLFRPRIMRVASGITRLDEIGIN